MIRRLLPRAKLVELVNRDPFFDHGQQAAIQLATNEVSRIAEPSGLSFWFGSTIHDDNNLSLEYWQWIEHRQRFRQLKIEISRTNVRFTNEA